MSLELNEIQKRRANIRSKNERFNFCVNNDVIESVFEKQISPLQRCTNGQDSFLLEQHQNQLRKDFGKRRKKRFMKMCGGFDGARRATHTQRERERNVQPSSAGSTSISVRKSQGSRADLILFCGRRKSIDDDRE